MKKLLSLLVISLIFCSCSKEEEKQAPETKNIPSAEIKTSEEIYSFDINTLEEGCNSESQMICAINLSIKCTINPEFSECIEHKKEMPDFIFMEDESLKRPTSQSYKITKIKPLEDSMVEIYTQSTCNGNWFGLCNGNIIYVMSFRDGKWVVKDLYAIES